MKKRNHTFKTILLTLSAVFLLTSAGVAAEVKTVNKDELKALMDKGTVTVIDVRSGRDWSSSEFKIKGAVRIAPGDGFLSEAKTLPKDRTLVLYCA